MAALYYSGAGTGSLNMPRFAKAEERVSWIVRTIRDKKYHDTPCSSFAVALANYNYYMRNGLLAHIIKDVSYIRPEILY